MHKKELIVKLLSFSESNPQWRGQATFARYLAVFLESLDIPADSIYDFWRIEPYLTDICVDAFEQLRTSTKPVIVDFRKRYEEETEHPVPNLLDLGESDILHQGHAVQVTLGFMLANVLDSEYIGRDIDAYCNAQKYVLQQTFDKFLCHVYRNGMFDIIKDCDERGMSAKFGNTTLRTYIMAGRIMFTFARKEDDQVTFIAEDGDPLCYSAGLQSLNVNFRSALDLIEDVIKHWPKVQKSGAFKAKELAIC